ncbi:MAG: tRNA 2-selenouridine(34) synthase MnmH [Gammaproteobacteria bacterium]
MNLPWDGFDGILDARSPAEFAEDCIPGAVNLPALSDAERAEVGALYKSSPFAARLRGAGFVAANISAHLQKHLAAHPREWRPLVYCWRGGRRSGAVAEVLRQIGWDAAQLSGGYKFYRQTVINGICELSAALPFFAIGGKTGAGKTLLLAALRDNGESVLDLEALGCHRGSVFGATGAQPSQRKFESALFEAMRALPQHAPVFVETEGRKIGALHVPRPLLFAARQAPLFYAEAELAARARRVAGDYAAFQDSALFESALAALGKYAAPRRRYWREYHARGEWEALAADLLSSFYDIGYEKSLAANYGKPAAVFRADPNCPQALQKTARALAQKARLCAEGGKI